MNELIHDTALYRTKPPSEGRQEREMAVYELLEELQIAYERLDHEATATIEACHDVDKLLGIEICKNLFLCNTQKTKFYLLMMPGWKKFGTKEVSKQIQSPRLSFAPAEYMEEYLKIAPGAVSVMGLMNDRDNKVQLLMDKEVLESEYMGCHPCVNTSSLKLKTVDVVEKFLPFTKHDYIAVELAGDRQQEISRGNTVERDYDTDDDDRGL